MVDYKKKKLKRDKKEKLCFGDGADGRVLTRNKARQWYGIWTARKRKRVLTKQRRKREKLETIDILRARSIVRARRDKRGGFSSQDSMEKSTVPVVYSEAIRVYTEWQRGRKGVKPRGFQTPSCCSNAPVHCRHIRYRVMAFFRAIQLRNDRILPAKPTPFVESYWDEYERFARFQIVRSYAHVCERWRENTK